MLKLCVYAGTLLSLFISSSTLKAVEPSWWLDRGVIAVDPVASTRLQASDYAVANIGQLKNFAFHAKAELDAKLPGGAGDEINALIGGFLASSSNRNDYGSINLGQLKAVSKLFWDRLIEEEFAESYPWGESLNAPSDYALANLGQLKTVFNFSVDDVDTDDDGLPDWWEIKYFGNLDSDNDDDNDGDGINNEDEYSNNTNPSVAQDSDADGVPDHVEIIEGSNPNDPDSSSKLLSISIYTHLEK